MKVEVLQEKLAIGIGLTNRIASTRTTLPILANTLLEAADGRLKLSGTNLEVSLEYWVGGKVEQEGKATTSTNVLNNYIQNLTPEKLTLALQDNQLVIGGTASEARFVTMAADEFPTFPSVSSDVLLTLSPNKLQAILKKILFAAATNESRPVLTGVLCRGTSEGLILVATDGFRLAEVTVAWSAIDAQPPTEPVEMIIPAKMLKEIGQFSGISEDAWELRLTEDKNQVVFTTPDMRMYARLLEAEYPRYEAIIPTDFATTVQFDKDALIQAVKTAAIFAHAQSHTIRVQIDQDQQKAFVRGESNELGRQETTLPVTVTGQSLETAFNANYLLDALTGIEGDQVVLQMRAADAPSLFVAPEASDQESVRQIIMPVRLDRQNS